MLLNHYLPLAIHEIKHLACWLGANKAPNFSCALSVSRPCAFIFCT